MTFSIVARSSDARLFGMAIASSSPAVAARCMHARAGVGAVATQNITDPSLGPRVLDVLGRGLKAQAALDEALSATPFAAYRQLLAIGSTGPPAIHSGAQGLGVVNAAIGANAAAAGNLLASPAVPAAMIAAFEAATGHLGDCLLQALHAGLDTGGEAGPVHSAGLLIVRGGGRPVVGFRGGWADEHPPAAFSARWGFHAPQIAHHL